MNDTIMKVNKITKTFPGVKALDEVNFELRKGEIHALIGENGAGKTTLMHVMCGVHLPDNGDMYLNGKRVSFNGPMEAQSNGIAIVFQELSLIPELSIAENVYAGRQPTNILGMINFRKLNKDTKKLLEIFNMNNDPRTPVKYLSIAEQQVVEILKAISLSPDILILDEPTSSLTSKEAEALFKNIEILKNRGVAIVYISHHLSEIFQIADRATVLRDGKFVKTVNLQDVTTNDIVKLMIGREIIHKRVDRKSRIKEELLLELKDFSGKQGFNNVNLSVKKGEIVGVAGLVGSGRSEFAKAMIGLDRSVSGEMWLDGTAIKPHSVAHAMEHGLAYTSENRKTEGLFIDKTIKDNCVSTKLKDYEGKFLGFLHEREMTKDANEITKRLNVVSRSINQHVRNLSGGNQQKVLLSMWLGINPKLLVVDEPTKGVDVGAKAEIYAKLRELADTGVGIIVISSDLPEVLTLSDKVVVMKDGRTVKEFPGEYATEESVMSYATGTIT